MIESGPAYLAGVRAGQQLLEINGQPVSNMMITPLSLQGPDHSLVTLTVSDAAKGQVKIQVQRRAISTAQVIEETVAQLKNSDDEKYINRLACIANYYYHINCLAGNVDQAVSVYKLILPAIQSSPGPNSVKLIYPLSCFISICGTSSVPKYREEMRSAETDLLRICEAQTDMKSVELAIHELHRLGTSYANASRALPFLQLALKLSERTPGIDKLTSARLLDIIAYRYTKLGNYDEAIRFFQKGVRIVQEEEKGNWPNGGHPSGNLVIACMKVGRYSDAEPFLKEDIRLLEAYWGKDTWRTCGAWLQLAQLTEAQGDSVKAEGYYKKAVATSNDGSTHPGFGAFDNYAQFLKRLGRSADATKVQAERDELYKASQAPKSTPTR